LCSPECLDLKYSRESFILFYRNTPQLCCGDEGHKSGLGTDHLTFYYFYAAAPRMPRLLCCGVRRRSFRMKTSKNDLTEPSYAIALRNNITSPDDAVNHLLDRHSMGDGCVKGF